ncbi:MAG: hypothetical protein ACOZFS_10885 [Thermodesulfobacteriota bacterium]
MNKIGCLVAVVASLLLICSVSSAQADSISASISPSGNYTAPLSVQVAGRTIGGLEIPGGTIGGLERVYSGSSFYYSPATVGPFSQDSATYGGYVYLQGSAGPASTPVQFGLTATVNPTAFFILMCHLEKSGSLYFDSLSWTVGSLTYEAPQSFLQNGGNYSFHISAPASYITVGITSWYQSQSDGLWYGYGQGNDVHYSFNITQSGTVVPIPGSLLLLSSGLLCLGAYRGRKLFSNH